MVDDSASLISLFKRETETVQRRRLVPTTVVSSSAEVMETGLKLSLPAGMLLSQTVLLCYATVYLVT